MSIILQLIDIYKQSYRIRRLKIIIILHNKSQYNKYAKRMERGDP